MKRTLRPLGQPDEDPLQGVANFFDLGIVFALGFLLALLSYLGLPRLEQMEKEQARPLPEHQVSTRQASGKGERLGTAYRLESGEVVYVPDDQAPK